MPVQEQVIIIYVAGQGHLDDLPADSCRRFEKEFLAFMREKYPDVGHDIMTKKVLEDAVAAKIDAAAKEFKQRFKQGGKPAAGASSGTGATGAKPETVGAGAGR